MTVRPFLPATLRAPSGARKRERPPIYRLRCRDCYTAFLDVHRTRLCQTCYAEQLAELGVTISTDQDVIFPERHFSPWGLPSTMEEMGIRPPDLAPPLHSVMTPRELHGLRFVHRRVSRILQAAITESN